MTANPTSEWAPNMSDVTLSSGNEGDRVVAECTVES